MRVIPFILSISALLCAINSYGQYTINTIPDDLLKNANAVIRSEEAICTIKSAQEYELETTIIVSILNEKGKEHALIALDYDRWTKADISSATLYNKNGEKRARMKKSDIIERSAFTRNKEAMDYSDTKIKAFFFDVDQYPYTVEYKTILTSKNTMTFPGWSPLHSFDVAVEKATYKVIHPTDYILRISYPDKFAPAQTKHDGKKVFTWEAKNLKAIPELNLMPPNNEIFSVVYCAPAQFDLDGNKGNLSTWGQFSNFLYRLNEGRNILGTEEIKKINEISNQHQSKEEKVAALYKYMQQKTRYVSMQYGIGGYQPYKASYVSEKGYGDCKALSNYMQSVLHAAAIPAYYALVNAGHENDEPVNEDFPQNKFNHVILCVPNNADTIWLECTNQSLPAGYLGSFTANRKALLASKEGGALVQTQRLGSAENTKIRNIHAVVDSLGNYQLSCNNHYRGMRQDELFMRLNSSTSTEIKQGIERELPLQNFTISDIKHNIIGGKIPVVHETILVSTSSAMPSAKNAIYVPLSILPHTHDWYSALLNEERDIPFSIPFSGANIDTVVIQIPDLFYVEGFPPAKDISNEFGKYSTQYILNEAEPNKITVVQSFLFHEQTFTAEKYGAFKKFIEEINSTDRGKIILVKEKNMAPSNIKN